MSDIVKLNPQWEFYPEKVNSELDNPLYRLEFHTWDGEKWTWKLTERSFVHSIEECNILKEKFPTFFMGREGHPYSLIEDDVLPDRCIPNKQWLKWMCDALNEKALKEYHIKNKKVTLDPFTIGNTPAAIHLVKIINEPDNQKYSKRVNRLLNKLFIAFKNIKHIDNSQTEKIYLAACKDRYLEILDKTTFPEVIKSHVRNVIITKYRAYLENTQ